MACRSRLAHTVALNLTTPPSPSKHARLECPAAIMMIEQAFSGIYQRAQTRGECCSQV